MSDRKSANMLAIKPRTTTHALAAGVNGILMMVDGKIFKDSLPLDSDATKSLIHEVGVLASCYSEGGLPPRTFFSQFTSSSLLVLFSRRSMLIIWMDLSANLSEVEKAGRKLVSTAHLSGSHRAETILLPADPKKATALENRPTAGSLSPTELAGRIVPPTHLTLIKIMSWSEATNALESILTKVLTHAQAARMIERTLTDKRVDTSGPFDVHQFQEVGSELMLKIPNRSIRQSLANEFAALVTRLS